MSKAAGKTGIGPTALLAIEQYFPREQQGLEDVFAFRMLPLELQSFVKLMRFNSIRNWMIRSSEKSLPGIWGGVICRKKYIDDHIIKSVNWISSVVNLGAGFDTRALRLNTLSEKSVFEIDQPENIQKKRKQLLKIFGCVPAHLKLIAIDFDTEDLTAVLKMNGYSFKLKTFYIMEGVTQYLTEKGIHATFQHLAKAATGSQLIFSYVRKDFLDGSKINGWQQGYKTYVLKNKIWLFGMLPEQWPVFLKQYSWQVVQDISYKELAEKYIKPTGRKLASTSIERMLLAKKT